MFDAHHVFCDTLIMELAFTNRLAELKELESAAAAGGLLVVFGRRRVGKTRLLTYWMGPRQGLYSQAIEGAKEIQLEQVFRDIQDRLTTSLVPKSWGELLELLEMRTGPSTFCLDEFPYLVASDPSLPSVLQRWLDHRRPKNFLLILAGSSTRMMNNLFLNRSAPLYGRARKLLHIEPMSYGAFCAARRLNPADQESFTRFALVGGVPKYWEFVESKASAIDLADELFFGFAPYLDQEPSRVLRDEGISGVNAISVLEAIGRGAEKSSEIAARLGTVQTNLSRLLQQLLDASVLTREIPFGESPRSTKKTRYSINDPALRFWFRVYSPHRTRWRQYGHTEKARLLRDHASTVFEDFCRQRHAAASRYWEGNLEFDFVRADDHGPSGDKAIVTEVKWKRLTAKERAEIEKRLAADWQRCALRGRFKQVAFDVLDATVLNGIHHS
jgi:AAA+ ATPase superfamily predicted ATPase